MLSDICLEMGAGFNARRFVPYIMMHEFEGLLFSDCRRFSEAIGRIDLGARLQAIRAAFGTPEEINDSPQTCPSKRLLQLIPDYEKPLLGNLAVIAIGFDAIARECPLFRDWLERLARAL